jgi:exosortase
MCAQGDATRLEDTSEKSWISLDSWTWTRALYVLGVGGMLFAYQSLLTLGTRWSFSLEVEYWLFRPGGNAPLVVIGLAGWLVYRRWWRLRTVSLQVGPLWLIVGSLVLGAGFYVWAAYTGAEDLKAVSLVLNAVGLIALHWGVPGLRALWLPLVFVLFCIPAPAPLLLAVIWKLQLWTADLAGWFLYLLGIPALVSGDLIFRASETFQVIEGCSGMRSIEILTMLTLLLVDLFRRTGAHAIILIVLAPLVAFALNGLRVLTLILNPHSEIVSIHNLQGIAILLVGLLIIYGLDGLLERFTELDSGPADLPDTSRSRSHAFPSQAAVGVLLAVGLMAHLSSWVTPTWQRPKVDRRVLSRGFDAAMSDWSFEDLEANHVFEGSARYGEAVYESRDLGTGHVTIWVGRSDFAQRGGSVMSPKTALPGPGWRVRQEQRIALGAQSIAGVERIMEKGKQRMLVRHWYQGSRGLLGETFRSFIALDRSAWSRAEPMLAVRLSTPLLSRSDKARAAARALLDRVYDRLAPVLDEVGAGLR